MTRLGFIVEGHGETEALPTLVRRIVDWSQCPELELLPPFRSKKPAIVDDDELAALVRFQRDKLGGAGVMLISCDADQDCPANLGPSRVEVAREVAPDCLVSAVLPKVEFEAWFLGSLESLRGVRGIKHDAVSPEDPEAVRDAKGALSQVMQGSRAYSPTADQPALAAEFDITASRERCPSLDKLCRDIERLIGPLAI